MDLSEVDYQTATDQVAFWAARYESRYICAANVHMLMEAWDSKDFLQVVNRADMVAPDGMPLVWMMRMKGWRGQTRVYGPTLMLHVLAAAEKNGLPVGFYGSSPDVLDRLIERMSHRYPGLKVTFSYSPPFRAVSDQEDEEIVQRIHESGARILFVALGCPKQEKWMADHKDRLRLVMLGVGAAFDFHAGTKPQSPAWMQAYGLEWIYRLWVEPRRLWRRYLWHNPRFVFLAVLDLLGFLR
jgi:N-acetylglucosaminyldiphosphoundecaprenol N-acetyl-beta-D-mannosaminyltransferase